MKTVYRQVQANLIGILPSTPKGHKAKRMNTLCGLVTGLICKGKSALSVMSRGILKNIDSASKTAAAKRFVSNKWIDSKTYYLPFIHDLLAGIIHGLCPTTGIRTVIDGSQIGKNHAALMVSIVWRKRGIPICWLVKNGSKGHFSTQDHIDVLKEAYKILASLLLEMDKTTIPITLLGDGEFDSTEIQDFCKDSSWNYVLRTASNTVLYKDDELFHARDIYPDETHTTFCITDVLFTRKKYGRVNFLSYYNRHKYKAPIVLLSNLDCANAIMEHYDRRFSIECFFRDIKSSSFNVHKTRLKHKDEIHNLLIIACLAFILMVKIARKYDEAKFRKKVQRVRNDQKVLSFFTFAYRLIAFFVENHIQFSFDSQISKNSC